MRPGLAGLSVGSWREGDRRGDRAGELGSDNGLGGHRHCVARPAAHHPHVVGGRGVPAIAHAAQSRHGTGRRGGRPVPAGVEVTDLTELSDDAVLDLWTEFYVRIHAGWSPVADRQAAREIFAPMMTEELDRRRSVLVRDGRPSAVGFTFQEGEEWLVCCETVAQDIPHGLADVDTCLRAVVARLAGSGERSLLVDGHVVDPHLYPALQKVPRVTGAGLHLLHLR